MRPIDADVLVAELKDRLGIYPACVKKAIENAPTVDVEVVVRCKNCRNSDMLGYIRYCFHWERDVDDNGYCQEGV